MANLHSATKPGLVRWGTVLGLTIASALAWIAPANKPHAVMGHLNYLQFWLAMFLTATAFSELLVALAPAPKRRATGFKVITIWLGFGLALAGMELTAYLLPPEVHRENPWYSVTCESVDLPFERPPRLEWRGLSRGDLTLKDNIEDPAAQVVTFRTDMQGFHNSADLKQADLVVIGDSFAEAGNLPVQDNFTALAGEQLALPSRNLSRAGYTAPTELIVLKKYGLPCRPKIVVWQIASSNDLQESLDYLEWIHSGRKSYGGRANDGRISRHESWRQRSPTYWLFSHIQDNEPQPCPSADIFGGQFKGRNGVEVPIRFLISPALKQPALNHPGWDTFAKSLMEGASLCQSQGIYPVVVLIPSKFRVLGPYTALPDSVATMVSSLAGLPESRSLAPLLRSFCATNGIPFIDSTSALRQRAATGDLVYLPFDTHLSASGHQVVAELIVDHLKKALYSSTSH